MKEIFSWVGYSQRKMIFLIFTYIRADERLKKILMKVFVKINLRHPLCDHQHFLMDCKVHFSIWEYRKHHIYQEIPRSISAHLRKLEVPSCDVTMNPWIKIFPLLQRLLRVPQEGRIAHYCSPSPLAPDFSGSSSNLLETPFDLKDFLYLNILERLL